MVFSSLLIWAVRIALPLAMARALTRATTMEAYRDVDGFLISALLISWLVYSFQPGDTYVVSLILGVTYTVCCLIGYSTIRFVARYFELNSRFAILASAALLVVTLVPPASLFESFEGGWFVPFQCLAISLEQAPLRTLLLYTPFLIAWSVAVRVRATTTQLLLVAVLCFFADRVEVASSSILSLPQPVPVSYGYFDHDASSKEEHALLEIRPCTPETSALIVVR